MASREEILADFQACTGIDDVGIAIAHLEEANWALVDAVNKVMPSNSPVAPQLPVPSFTSSTFTQERNQSTGLTNDEGGGGNIPTSISGDIRTASTSSFTPYQNSVSPIEIPPYPSRSVSSGVSIADDFMSSVPGSSNSAFGSSRTRMLEFNVQHGDRIVHLKVPDNEDVKTLKTLLQGETGFPPCQQELTGFRSGGSPIYHVSDRRRLSELNLPKENVLYLNTPPEENDDDVQEPTEQGDFKIHLVVTKEDSSKKTFDLNFRPTCSVLNVKLDVSTFTNIPVSRQKWSGWPEGITDDLTLAQIGIKREHHMSLSIAPRHTGRDMPDIDVDMEASTSGSSARGPTAVATDSQNSNHVVLTQSTKATSGGRFDPDDDIEDLNDSDEFDDPPEIMDEDSDIFSSGGAGQAVDITSNRRPHPLLPDDYGDEAMAAIRFSEEFTSRYGRPRPAFFPATLDDAIKESCMQPARDRKILAVYLHHDSSVFTNVFCSTCLCADSVVSFLDENFICFGWDLTFQSNRSRAVNMITKHFGSVAASSVKALEIERLPMIALIYRLRGTTEIFQMIEGNVSLDELMSRLITAQETYQSQLSLEIKEDDERAARDAVKREQDLAFEMSLVADREKDATKKREEEEKLEKERLEAAIRHSEEMEKEKKDREMAKLRSNLMLKLPKEPKEEKEEGKPVSKIRFRVPVMSHEDDADNANKDDKRTQPNGVVGGAGPGGNQLERRFLASQTLQTVLDYLTIKGYPSSEYKVLSSWPRRDLTTLDTKQTLMSLKLYPQDTLILEEK